MLQRHTTKPQTLRFSSHTSLFWTLPEQLSILHHACVPTHPEDTPQNLRPQDFHLTHPSFELCRSNSPYYTMHMCQPILNQRPKTHYKLQSENVHLSHPWFELCLNNSEKMTPRICANPEPMLQRHTTKPQTLKFSSHTSLFRTLPEQLSILHHALVPTHPEPTSQDTLQTSIRKFSSHTSLFWTLPEQLGTDDTTHLCQPWTNVAKTHHKTSDPKMFISHIPVLNFAGTALHVTPRMCANPSWTNVPRHTTNFNPKMFISHIPVSNFAWTTRNRWHHACAPTLNQCCKDTPQNLRP